MVEATEKQILYILRLFDETGVKGIEVTHQRESRLFTRTSTKVYTRDNVHGLSKVEASAVITSLLELRDS